jgi:peptidoglycan glycosyltransferase
VANKGSIMTPHLLREVRDSNGNLSKRYDPSEWLRPLDADKAAVMDSAMQEVVARGTATAAQVPGFTVGAKTGTAQIGLEPPRSHTWMIAYAGPPGQPPTVAVAVVVLDQPGTGDATGGRIAGPIAQRVLQAALTLPPADQVAAANAAAAAAATTTTSAAPGGVTTTTGR